MNEATGKYAHVEGGSGGYFEDDEWYYSRNIASGDTSHAEGSHTTASGSTSHAEGNYTIANHKAQHVFGEHNIQDDSTASASSRGTYVEIVENGTSTAKSNARTLDWSGNEWLAGSLTLGNTTLTEAQLQALLELLS